MTKEKIYMIPGLMTDERLWSRVRKYLENDYELVHIPIPDFEYFDEMVEEIDAKFEEDEINLLGFSLGSYLASYYTIKNPSRVKRLLNVSATPSGITTSKELERRKDKIKAMEKDGFQELSYEKAVSLVEEQNQDDEELIQIIQNMFNDLGKDKFITQMKSTFNRVDLLDKLVKLDIPVHYFVSKDDRLLNKASLDELINKKHNLEIIIREGTSHNIPLEEPQMLSEKIRKWLI